MPLRATRILLPLLFLVAIGTGSCSVEATDTSAAANETDDAIWHVGLAKVDITPKEPVRMAGYGSRNRPSEGVDLPLAVRCLALLHRDDRPSSPTEANAIDATPNTSVHLLVSIETIGLSGSLGREISERIAAKHGVPRHGLVLASTHTHCAPDLVSELSNIFVTPLTDDEREAGLRYKDSLVEAVVTAAGKAIADLQPGRVNYAVGQATFAANRRVLENGRWKGFGVQADGPVDHSLPVLCVSTVAGDLRGIVYNYACHGTTLGGNHYRINGDWPGFASATLESRHPGVIAISTIGCGADANPSPHGTLEDAVAHGRVMSDAIDLVLAQPMRAVTKRVESTVDHAALTFELPTIEEVRQRIDNAAPQVSRHARQLDAIYREEGRLPATYPVPIQAWRFGDELTMLFLGGEVVVDYALRLKREVNDDNLWVTAYCGDVLGYIASERMRHEGGYEFDRSGVFYGLPGPWAAGTEDQLINQLLRLLKGEAIQSPVSANEAIQTMYLSSNDYRIELIASEPLVQDPINLAFGADGKLWVVEMGDYPGEDGEANNGRGRVKFLEDSTGDGRYDRATVFLDGISFPTGVFPWRDGVIVSAAPDILMAKDTDGDGRADSVETLYTGFPLANPQHRVSGFTYGMDHSLHCASGDKLGKITSLRNGDVIDASGHDIQIWPDDGRIAVTSGRTQYIRSCDDWGHWFGNDNSHPMFHFPIDSRHLRRNRAILQRDGSHQLFDPPVAPPVFPATSSDARFNDIYAASRFTSACSSIIARSPFFDSGGLETAFVCEPVHNLIHRATLVSDGASYRATRSQHEKATEFLVSTDPWFRPVRCEIGPEGALWVVDMYRETIEHPEWIPRSWQTQLDLRAGCDRGRIYRIVPAALVPPKAMPESIAGLPSHEWVDRLGSPIGTLRDMAARLLIERYRAGEALDDREEIIQRLRTSASQSDSPQGRAHSMAVLDVLGRLDDSRILAALDDLEPGVLIVAMRLAESRLPQAPEMLERLASLSTHADARVLLSLAILMGQCDSPAAADILADLAARDDLDRWITRAILSSSAPHANRLLDRCLDRFAESQPDVSDHRSELISGLIETAAADGKDLIGWMQKAVAHLSEDGASADLRVGLSLGIARSLARGRVVTPESLKVLEPIHRRALEVAADPTQSERRRCEAIHWIGRGIGPLEQERDLLVRLLVPVTPPTVQRTAITALADIDPEGFADCVIDRWKSMTTLQRGDCVNLMLTRQTSIDRLLSAMESGTIAVNELSAAARQQLLHAGTRSLMVRAQRLISAPGRSMAKRELIDTYLSQFGSSEVADDLVDGAALYAKHCGNCHTADERSEPIGPTLINLSDRSDRALVQAILDPNLAVEPKYQSYIVRTVDDEILVGAVESESGDALTLGRADGTRVLVDRSRILELKNSGVSLMPEGFEALLRPADLEAIVRYLQRPRGR